VTSGRLRLAHHGRLLNCYLEAATIAHPPLVRIKLRYMTQIKARPPTFVLFAAKADDLPDAYARYLVNGIRERFDLQFAEKE
jgi:GTP-binding protein